jgi:hypothetical protein
LNQASTKWRHEIQTKERAELQLKQYKDEVMMLQEALVIASHDMAKMQALLGPGGADEESSAGAADEHVDKAALFAANTEQEEEARGLLYAYIRDLGHDESTLSAEDKDVLVGMVMQASESGTRNRIDAFMTAARKPTKTRRKFTIREDGAYKSVTKQRDT